MANVTDNFNRADESPLAGDWTTSASMAAMVLVGNKVAGGTQGTDSGAYWTADEFEDDQNASLLLETGTTDYTGVICRGYDADIGNGVKGNNYSARCDGQNVTVAYVNEWNDGSESTLETISVGYSRAQHPYIKLDVSGTTVQAFKSNNNAVWTAISTAISDSTHASGRAGIRSYNWSASAYYADDFEAGPVVAVGGVIPVLMNQYRQRWS